MGSSACLGCYTIQGKKVTYIFINTLIREWSDVNLAISRFFKFLYAFNR